MNTTPNTPEMRALSAFFASSVNAKLDSAKMREAMIWSLASQPGAVGEPIKLSNAWAYPKDSYAMPVLFNPYTGEPRDARDVQSDPRGVLIAPPGNALPLAAAPTESKPAQQDAVDAERWRAVRDAPAGSGIALVIPGVEGYTVHLSGDEADHIVDGVIERAAISAKKGSQ